MNKCEILAPVGSSESLRAAVLSGADAVYFGMGRFNARRNVKGLDGDLKDAISYCHSRGVKVHITLNTLIKDSEIREVEKDIKTAYLAGADAFIIQDLGVAKMVREICPDVEMHASTQMSVGTPEGLHLLKELGFKRAVLPRELSLEEIQEICKDSPIDLEIFIHGALCMCVSGQCLMSAVLGSRSGNRGLCAQPCRLPFSVQGGTGHDLSLKDLSLIEHIPELTEMGIKSFKIEGRMKRPEYVAAAVTACRESVSGSCTEERASDLKNLFSRSGFTKGYYDGKLGREMFGFREKENVLSADKELLGRYAELYRKEEGRFPVSFDFHGKPGEKIRLKCSCLTYESVAESDELFETPLKNPISKERILESLSKCGGTPFYMQKASVDDEPDYFLPISTINNLRREALESIEKQMSSIPERKTNDFIFSPEGKSYVDIKTYCSFDNISQIPDNISADLIFLPAGTDDTIIRENGYGLELPHGMFGKQKRVERILAETSADMVLCHTLDSFALTRKSNKKIVLSPSMNILNSISAQIAKDLGADELMVSNECILDNANSLQSPVAKGIFAYGRIPLMVTRNCPVKNGKSCEECRRSSYITDRMGIHFPVKCSMGYSEVLNSRPVYMADRMNEIRDFDFIYMKFTTETKDEIIKILDDYKKKSPPDIEFTRGLLYRGVE